MLAPELVGLFDSLHPTLMVGGSLSARGSAILRSASPGHLGKELVRCMWTSLGFVSIVSAMITSQGTAPTPLVACTTGSLGTLPRIAVGHACSLVTDDVEDLGRGDAASRCNHDAIGTHCQMRTGRCCGLTIGRPHGTAHLQGPLAPQVRRIVYRLSTRRLRDHLCYHHHRLALRCCWWGPCSAGL
jgi:hypothetical protein